ncbi:MAG: zinc ribbon domain-containing protein [Deltaproteobacteria bacterium]|uniref:hypothetical protein n=1 Tax=Hydrosulfovibrio ferrireducens TaxID=2934181 RepID=UPI001206A32F|nr:MAG: zinc ribbon domain-containing protein [Deltaproteobacteria bacterium]
MHCTECGKDANEQDKFCSECGNNLRNSNGIVISSRENSINFGQNNQLAGNTINVNPVQDPRETAYINRTKIKPLSVAGIQLKASWLLVSGLIGFFGSIASILGFIGTGYQFPFIISMSIGIMLFPIGMMLMQSKHFNFPPFFNLESGSNGEIYITKIEGDCPKCTGKLKLRSVGPKNMKTIVVRCTRNPDHIWGFDPTVLPDL